MICRREGERRLGAGGDEERCAIMADKKRGQEEGLATRERDRTWENGDSSRERKQKEASRKWKRIGMTG